jgi:hypothetical protein
MGVLSLGSAHQIFATFGNLTITPSGRKVTTSEEGEKREEKKRH